MHSAPACNFATHKTGSFLSLHRLSTTGCRFHYLSPIRLCPVRVKACTRLTNCTQCLNLTVRVSSFCVAGENHENKIRPVKRCRRGDVCARVDPSKLLPLLQLLLLLMLLLEPPAVRRSQKGGTHVLDVFTKNCTDSWGRDTDWTARPGLPPPPRPLPSSSSRER